MLTSLADSARERVASGFRSMVSGDPTGAPEWVRQLAHGTDTGYFGPGSAAWAVHGSLPTLVGGIRALLMQALHPGCPRRRHAALALRAGRARPPRRHDAVAHRRHLRRHGGRRPGVRARARHAPSRHRHLRHRAGRARRTPPPTRTCCAGCTSPSPTPSSPRTGCGAGRSPAARTRTCGSGPRPASSSASTNPPRSVAELEQQIADYGPDLRGGEAALRTVDFIRNVPVPLAGKPAYAVLFAGAVSTMPPEHRRLLELPTLPQLVTKPAVGAILGSPGAWRSARRRRRSAPRASASSRWRPLTPSASTITPMTVMTIDMTTALLRSSQSRTRVSGPSIRSPQDGVEEHRHGDRDGRDPGEHGDGQRGAAGVELRGADRQPGGGRQEQHLGVGVGEHDGQSDRLDAAWPTRSAASTPASASGVRRVSHCRTPSTMRTPPSTIRVHESHVGVSSKSSIDGGQQDERGGTCRERHEPGGEEREACRPRPRGEQQQDRRDDRERRRGDRDRQRHDVRGLVHGRIMPTPLPRVEDRGRVGGRRGGHGLTTRRCGAFG